MVDDDAPVQVSLRLCMCVFWVCVCILDRICLSVQVIKQANKLLVHCLRGIWSTTLPLCRSIERCVSYVSKSAFNITFPVSEYWFYWFPVGWVTWQAASRRKGCSAFTSSRALFSTNPAETFLKAVRDYLMGLSVTQSSGFTYYIWK